MKKKCKIRNENEKQKIKNKKQNTRNKRLTIFAKHI